jgi:hypothetical protein
MVPRIGFDSPSTGPRNRPVIALATLCVLGLSGLRSSAAAADVTLEELHDGYAQSVESMRTVWTRSTWSRTANLDDPVHPTQGFGNITVDWAIDGAKWHVHVHPRGDRPPIMEKWISFDGRRVWHPEFSENHEIGDYVYVRHRSLATATDNRLRKSLTPGSFLGLYFNIDDNSQSGASLATVLSRPDAVLQGEDEVDGHPCYRIDGRFPTTHREVTWPVSVWLDPAAGHLPRKIEATLGPQPRKPVVLTVHEFQQVPPSEGTVLWFPQRCVMENVFVTDELIVAEVTINEPVAESLFRPKRIPNVPVFDLDKEQDVQRLLSVSQKPAMEQARAEFELAREALQKPTPLSTVDPAVPATARDGIPGQYWLIIVGITLLGIGTWQVFRRT